MKTEEKESTATHGSTVVKEVQIGLERVEKWGKSDEGSWFESWRSEQHGQVLSSFKKGISSLHLKEWTEEWTEQFTSAD